MGISIAIEGSDGAGKTTLYGLAFNILNQVTRFPIMTNREPGGTPLGENIRTILKTEEFSNMHPMVSTFLFSAQRAELYYKKEKPFLDNNPHGILLKDRSWLSTFVFQEAEGADMEFIRRMQEPFLSIPDKFVLVDIPAEESLIRINASNESAYREVDWRDQSPKEKLQRIRTNYLNFAGGHRDKFVILDGFEDPFELAQKIVIESVGMVAEKEGFRDSSLERTISESTQSVVDKIRDPHNSFYEHLDAIEEVRQKRGLQSRQELQEKMHQEWRDLGLEDISSGTERRK